MQPKTALLLLTISGCVPWNNWPGYGWNDIEGPLWDDEVVNATDGT